MKRYSVPAAVCLLSIASSALAQDIWFDAGRQAQIMSNGQLLQQQTAPDQDRSPGTRARANDRSSGDREGAPNPMHCISQSERDALRREYERRMRADGRASADVWLRQTASEMGQRAGRTYSEAGSC